MKITCVKCNKSVAASDLTYNKERHKVNVCCSCATEVLEDVKNENIVKLMMKGYQTIDARAKVDDLDLDKLVIKSISKFLAKSSKYETDDIDEGLVRALSTKFPSLVLSKGKSVCPIEIDVDCLSKVERFQSGGWEDVIKKITASWVKENSFSGVGTIWDLGKPSVNFGHQSYSMFYAVLGMPEKFRKHLGTELEIVLGRKFVRPDSDFISPNSAEGWRAVCQIEDGKTWKIWDASAWQEVRV